MKTTPETAAEQIVAEGMHDLTYRGKQVTPGHARALADYGVSRLRAAGLLGGDPTEEQIEAVARELACLDEGDPWPTNAQLGGSLTGDRDMEYRSGMREQARDLLLVAARAAGVVPQEPPVLDPEQVAAVMGEHQCSYGDCMCGWTPTGEDALPDHQARALCEALRGGGR